MEIEKVLKVSCISCGSLNTGEGVYNYFCKDCHKKWRAPHKSKCGELCKYCHSEDIIRYGKYKGIQRYWCRTCERKFKNDGCLFNMRVPKEDYILALELASANLTHENITERINYYYGRKHSTATIFKWLKKKGLKIVRKYSHKSTLKPLSFDDELAIYANNTGIDIIDRVTENIPLVWRSDIRQEAALICLQKGIDLLSEDEIISIVNTIQKKSKQDYFRVKFKEIDLYSKPFRDSDTELVEMIADPNAENEIYNVMD